jgi:hypothetical protein
MKRLVILALAFVVAGSSSASAGPAGLRWRRYTTGDGYSFAYPAKWSKGIWKNGDQGRIHFLSGPRDPETRGVDRSAGQVDVNVAYIGNQFLVDDYIYDVKRDNENVVTRRISPPMIKSCDYMLIISSLHDPSGMVIRGKRYLDRDVDYICKIGNDNIRVSIEYFGDEPKGGYFQSIALHMAESIRRVN